MNMALCEMATKCHEDEGQNPVSMVFAGDSERHHFQNFVFFDKMYCSTSFLQFRGQKLEQVFFDIVLSPNILICLVVQKRIGQAIDPCLYTTTYEAFAPSPQLVNLLSSSDFALTPFFPSQVASELWATVFDLFKLQSLFHFFGCTFPVSYTHLTLPTKRIV